MNESTCMEGTAEASLEVAVNKLYQNCLLSFECLSDHICVVN